MVPFLALEADLSEAINRTYDVRHKAQTVLDEMADVPSMQPDLSVDELVGLPSCSEAAEHAGLVHPPEHDLGRMDAGQDFHEKRVGPGVLAHLAIDQHRVARGGAHRRRMDFEPFACGQREHFEQPHRIGAEEIVGRDGETSAIEQESAEPLGLAADGRQSETEPLLAQLFVELGEEHAGEVPDRPRV